MRQRDKERLFKILDERYVLKKQTPTKMVAPKPWPDPPPDGMYYTFKELEKLGLRIKKGEKSPKRSAAGEPQWNENQLWKPGKKRADIYGDGDEEIDEFERGDDEMGFDINDFGDN